MRTTLILSATLVAMASAVSAQTTPATRSGGLGGLLGSALPSVAQTGAGNAAGVLGYCVKNKLTTAASVSSVLGKLTGQKAVTETPGYTAGQSGILQTGSGALPIANLKGQVKTKVCDLVLKHATSLM